MAEVIVIQGNQAVQQEKPKLRVSVLNSVMRSWGWRIFVPLYRAPFGIDRFSGKRVETFLRRHILKKAWMAARIFVRVFFDRSTISPVFGSDFR